MTEVDELALKSFLEAYGSPPRPTPEDFPIYGHCDECQRHCEHIIETDLEDPGWEITRFEKGMGFRAFQFIVPAFARAALGDEYPEDYMLKFVELLDCGFVNALPNTQRLALRQFLDYCYASGMENTYFAEIIAEIDQDS